MPINNYYYTAKYSLKNYQINSDNGFVGNLLLKMKIFWFLFSIKFYEKYLGIT